MIAVLTFGVTLGFEKFLWGFMLLMIIGGFILTPIASVLTSKMPRRLLENLRPVAGSTKHMRHTILIAGARNRTPAAQDATSPKTPSEPSAQ